MPTSSRRPDRNLAMELVRVTESAALAASRWVGRGDKNGADGAAVAAMRTVLSTVTMDGVVVIGEGEKDQAPMLFNGEQVGDGTPPLVDVAVDPIDGTTLTAQGRTNALSVIAVSERESMFDPGPVVLHGEDRRRARRRRLDRHHRHADAEPALDRQGQAGERPRPHRRHPRPAAPRRADRRGAGERRAHPADHRRRRLRLDRRRLAGQRRRRADGRRRHARGRHLGRRAEVHGRRDPGPAVATQTTTSGRRSRPPGSTSAPC